MLIHNQPFWDKLKVDNRRLTEAVMHKKEQISFYSNVLIIVTVLCLVMIGYFLMKNTPEMVIYAVGATGLGLVFLVLKFSDTPKKEFGSLKERLMNNLKGKICTCSESNCSCRENFILYMENNEDINLSF